MTHVPPIETINWLTSGGLVTTLFVILYLGMSKRWRWGYQFDELQAELLKREEDLERMRTERDIWIERTLRLTKITDASVQTMKAVVTKVEE